MKNILLIILLLSYFSCKEKDEKNDVAKNTQKVESKKDVEESTNKIEFDADSFLSHINKTLPTKKTNPFYIKHDTLSINNWMIKNKDRDVFFTLISDYKNIHRYRFKNNKIEVSVLILTEDNHSEKVNKTFSYLRKMGMSRNRKTDLHPGLTYKNDYVFVYNESVFWLTTPCLVSYNNHLILSQHLNNMIIPNSDEAIDELFCKCGKVICENNND